MTAKWMMSLSNGETLDEDKVAQWEGNLKAYKKAINYVKERGLTVTSIRIQVNGAIHTGPSLSHQAKFKSDMRSSAYNDGQPFIWRGHWEKNLTSGHTEDFYKLMFQIEEPAKITWLFNTKTGDSWLRISAKEAE